MMELERYYNAEVRCPGSVPFHFLSGEQREALRSSFGFAHWRLQQATSQFTRSLRASWLGAWVLRVFGP